MQDMILDDYQIEMENRIRNLLWTVSGDYTLEMKPNVETFLRSKALALYDGIKQGAFAKYYDKDLLGMYLVKKIFLQGLETPLTAIAQLCIEEAIGEKIASERPGIVRIRRQAFLDMIDQEFEILAKSPLGRLKFALLKEKNEGSYKVEDQIREWMNVVYQAKDTQDTMDLIRLIDQLYNKIVDPWFENEHGDLEKVLSVTLEELTEFGWEDYLSEEMYEEALESYVQKITENMINLEESQVTEEMEEKRRVKNKITVLDPKVLEKAYTYVELNFGKTYLSPLEEKRRNYHLCRDIHGDCSLYYTEGILKNPVKRNYQLEYAKKQKDKNLWTYHDKHRIVKRNIALLTEMLKRSLVLRSETDYVLSDRGEIVPSRLWRIGRTSDAKVFQRELKANSADFVVDVLMDASGSQRSRQGDVALQGYIISEALSNAQIPHRVLSFCTFWDYTVLHRFRDYDDDRKANANLFDYITSSNNRDGLAIKAAGYDLLQRSEDKKIMIILSDGKPYDVVVNRPNARNPQPYQGKYAIRDTGFEVRKLRNLGVSVLGVFAGEEKDLATEKKIFGKDFAYIRDIVNFSRIVGRYLTKQLEADS